MKQLTKKQRHAIYLKATKGYSPNLDEFNGDSTPSCLCFAFASIIQKRDRMIDCGMYEDLPTILPEFGLFNPQTEYSFKRWWHDEGREWNGGDEPRYLALAFMIEMSK